MVAHIQVTFFGVINDFDNNDNNTEQNGLVNRFTGTGSGTRYGVHNEYSGTGNATFYGVNTEISASGSGTHYGEYVNMSARFFRKVCFYANIPLSTGGNHYGIYSNVTKSNSYAGYFLGRVSIGSNVLNNYILPLSRGTNGQIMQTDGTGNVSWVNTSSLISKTDPKVGTLSNNYIPKWSTSNLVNGILYDDGTKVGAFTTFPQSILDLNGDLALRIGSLVLVSGNNNNVSITTNPKSFYHITGPNGNFFISGLNGGVNGRIVTLYNNTSFTMSIPHLSSASAANNQIYIGTSGDTLVLQGYSSLTLQYNVTLSTWTVNSYSHGDFKNTVNQQWNLSGNNNVVDATHFLGSTNNAPLNFRVNNQKAGRIDSSSFSTYLGYRSGDSITTGTVNTFVGLKQELR
ncbi:MAG: hypothetical protein IPN26_15570 [Bacteroidetes bacterium]|nr:hypothetical protein [Bacteroidota bacterium]